MVDLNPVRKGVYHIPGLQYDVPEESFQDYLGFPPKVMVWGAIGVDYKSPLVLIDGHVTAEKYQELLEKSHAITDMDHLHGKNSWVFQQDGASSHTAQSTHEWLSITCKFLPIDKTSSMHWPAHSPDLNVIEQLWSIMKFRMHKPPGSRPKDLFLEAERVWNEISIEEINSLVRSFTHRLQAVIILQGESLNGHSRLLNELASPNANVEEIAARAHREMEEDQQFLRQSSALFSFALMGPEETRLARLTLRSIEIMSALPERTRRDIKFPAPDDLTEALRAIV
jgi:hypothetical protein